MNTLQNEWLTFKSFVAKDSTTLSELSLTQDIFYAGCIATLNLLNDICTANCSNEARTEMISTLYMEAYHFMEKRMKEGKHLNLFNFDS